MSEWTSYVENLGRQARQAAGQLVTLDGAKKVAALRQISEAISKQKDVLIAANAKDIEAAQQAGLAPALVERLRLNDKRVASMAEGVAQIAAQVDPVGQIIEGYVRPTGLRIQ